MFIKTHSMDVNVLRVNPDPLGLNRPAVIDHKSMVLLKQIKSIKYPKRIVNVLEQNITKPQDKDQRLRSIHAHSLKDDLQLASKQKEQVNNFFARVEGQKLYLPNERPPVSQSGSKNRLQSANSTYHKIFLEERLEALKKFSQPPEADTLSDPEKRSKAEKARKDLNHRQFLLCEPSKKTRIISAHTSKVSEQESALSIQNTKLNIEAKVHKMRLFSALGSTNKESAYDPSLATGHQPRKIGSAINLDHTKSTQLKSAPLITRFQSANVKKRLAESAFQTHKIRTLSKNSRAIQSANRTPQFLKVADIDIDLYNKLAQSLPNHCEPPLIKTADLYDESNYQRKELAEVVLRLGFLLTESSAIREQELQSCFGGTQSVTCQRLDFKRVMKYLLDGIRYLNKQFYKKAFSYFQKLSRQVEAINEPMLSLIGINYLLYCSFKLQNYNLAYKFNEIFCRKAKDTKWEFLSALGSLHCARRLLIRSEQVEILSQLAERASKFTADQRSQYNIQEIIQLLIEKKYSAAVNRINVNL
jgi:hypothetical protein